jgi:hypothetical protein
VNCLQIGKAEFFKPTFLIKHAEMLHSFLPQPNTLYCSA